LESSAEKRSALPEPGELLFKAKSDVSLNVASNSPSVSIRFVEGASGGEDQSRKTAEEDGSSAQPTSSPLPAASALRAEAISQRPTTSSMRQAKSLEILTVGAMWSSFTEEIILEKGSVGLGFSILDYQDPQNPAETVIVIRSLIRGSPASYSGAVLPGDRLVYVNDCRLDNASLDKAVQALKGCPLGPVRLGIAKPLEELVPRRQHQLSRQRTEGSGRIQDDTDPSIASSSAIAADASLRAHINDDAEDVSFPWLEHIHTYSFPCYSRVRPTRS